MARFDLNATSMRKLKNEELDRLSTEDFKAAKKTPIILVLDNVRSMNNIGSAFRTGDAFRIEMIVLTGITAKPPHRDIHKTALGATETINWQYFEQTAEALTWLKDEGFTTIAIEQADQSISLSSYEPAPNAKYALVFGNEVMGVSDKAMTAVDECIEIPQIGSKHSLNISVSIGVVLWDFAQKLGIFVT